MDLLRCEKCGSSEFLKKGTNYFCCYCRSAYVKPNAQPDSDIALGDDIARLLRKCRENPSKASRYASLILDIDPSNTDALQYL